MLQNITLPTELTAAIGSETIDFAVKAGRAQPLKTSLYTIFFGTLWTGFMSIFVFIFLGPLFLGQEVHFTANGVPTVAGPGNLGPIMAPALIIGVFVLVGIGMLASGFYSLFKKGGYFVGTPVRLIHSKDGNVRSIDWEQFSGDIEVNGDAQKGNISLQMRTGRMVSRKNRGQEYVPDVIYIAGITNQFEIEQICRKRIKENDPTPPAVK